MRSGIVHVMVTTAGAEDDRSIAGFERGGWPVRATKRWLARSCSAGRGAAQHGATSTRAWARAGRGHDHGEVSEVQKGAQTRGVLTTGVERGSRGGGGSQGPDGEGSGLGVDGTAPARRRGRGGVS